MREVDEYRRRSDDLLRAATKVIDLQERGRLIGEAIRWHMKAQEAERAAASARSSATALPFAPTPSAEQP